MAFGLARYRHLPWNTAGETDDQISGIASRRRDCDLRHLRFRSGSSGCPPVDGGHRQFVIQWNFVRLVLRQPRSNGRRLPGRPSCAGYRGLQRQGDATALEEARTSSGSSASTWMTKGAGVQNWRVVTTGTFATIRLGSCVRESMGHDSRRSCFGPGQRTALSAMRCGRSADRPVSWNYRPTTDHPHSGGRCPPPPAKVHAPEIFHCSRQPWICPL